MKLIYILTSFIAAAFLVTSCSEAGKSNESKQSLLIDQNFYGNIETIKAGMDYPEKELILTGKVISDPDKTISYTPLVSGVIDRTYFSLGDKVMKGQVLMDMRSVELTALQSELIALEGELKVSERELKTVEALNEDNLSSEKDLVEAQTRVRQIEAALDKIKADINVFGSDNGNGTFSLKAPVSGYILEKNISSGSTISADNDPLFTIADLSSVWIVANIYAGDIHFVREGMQADITSTSYPGEHFEGKIDAISQVFDPEDKTLKARIHFPNKDLKFKPEMSVTVRLKNKWTEEVVTVPSGILIFDNDTYYAVVRNSEDGFAIHPVVLYGQNKNKTYISEGLNLNEEVVSKNQLLIYSELKGK